MGDFTDSESDTSWSSGSIYSDCQETASTRKSHDDGYQDVSTEMPRSDQTTSNTTNPIIKITHSPRARGSTTVSASPIAAPPRPPMRQQTKKLRDEYCSTSFPSGDSEITPKKVLPHKEEDEAHRRQREANEMVEALEDVFQWISHSLNGMQQTMKEVKSRMDGTDETLRTVAQMLNSQRLTIQKLDRRMIVLENANPCSAFASIAVLKGGPKNDISNATSKSNLTATPQTNAQQSPAPVSNAPAKPTASTEKLQSSMGISLLKAAQQGRAEAARNLLNAGADVNFHYGLNWTSLHMAAKAHPGVLSVLLKRGANVNAKTTNGFTPLHIAAYFDYDGRCMTLLIDGGSDLDSQNGCGWTPLHYAAACGNEAGVKALLAGGANKTIKDHELRTARDVAARSVRHLLESARCNARRRPHVGHAKGEKDKMALPRWR